MKCQVPSRFVAMRSEGRSIRRRSAVDCRPKPQVCSYNVRITDIKAFSGVSVRVPQRNPGGGGRRRRIAGPADAVQNARRSPARGTVRGPSNSGFQLPTSCESVWSNTRNRAKGPRFMNLQELLKNAYKRARNNSLKCENENLIKSERKRNSDRSRSWIEALSCELFRVEKSEWNSIELFTKDIHNEGFKINEFLYDILIAKMDKTESKDEKIPLMYLKEAIWIVESEFSKNSHESVKDFSKLVIGNARYKLFIGPYIKRRDKRKMEKSNDQLRRVLERPARAASVSGNCYLGLVPHPKDWCKEEYDPGIVKCWAFDRRKDSWEECSS